MTLQSLLREAKRLNKKDRRKLAEQIMASIDDEWTDKSLPDWQKKELDRRLRSHAENPTAVVSWEQVEQELDKRAAARQKKK